ncbi:hypothetical protein GCM10023322_26760 [Rugosimonospora acidiphila]|uniref:Uncharacterized protein n=1 Tax=Rugosimonospora acidiphila TaxID=556531 RepID=A0ABP9RSE8_9ACTN
MRTFAVAFIAIVTGAGPQSKVMMPPAATAATTAAEVQLAAVPVPITRVGWLVSTALAAVGTVACPFGLPATNGRATVSALADGLGEPALGVGLGLGLGLGLGGVGLTVGLGAGAAARQLALAGVDPQPVRAAPSRSRPAATAVPRDSRTGAL